MRTTRSEYSRGVTLVELLVVIFIISILTVITISSVVAVREASRRVYCANNLRQLATACSSYMAGNGDALPPGYNYGGYSYLVTILPHLEQDNLYHSLNFSRGNAFFIAKPNNTLIRTRISAFVCPSESSSAPPESWTNYAGNRGVRFQVVEKYNGPMGGIASQPLRSRSITDGLSSTVMISEWMIGTQANAARDRVRTVFETEDYSPKEQYDQFAAACTGIDVEKAPLSVQRKGFQWVHGEYGRSLYNHDVILNGPTCVNGKLVQQGAWTASSSHGKGANVCFADSHVSFVRSSINLSIWRAIGSMNGGEIVEVP